MKKILIFVFFSIFLFSASYENSQNLYTGMDYLFKKFPELDSGGLTQMKQLLVSNESYSKFALEKKLGNGKVKKLADIFETKCGEILVESKYNVEEVWSYIKKLILNEN